MIPPTQKIRSFLAPVRNMKTWERNQWPAMHILVVCHLYWGRSDVGSPVGLPDQGPTDVEPPAVGCPDVGPTDVGPPDVGCPDVGPTDVEPPDVGCPDLGPTGVGPPAVECLHVALPDVRRQGVGVDQDVGQILDLD